MLKKQVGSHPNQWKKASFCCKDFGAQWNERSSLKTSKDLFSLKPC